MKQYETEREWDQMQIIKELEQRIEELEDEIYNLSEQVEAYESE